MTKPGRSINPTSYRHSFNGMETDNEVKSDRNSYDFGARMYDPRLGRWSAEDPLASNYPFYSPYSAMGNSPIVIIDPDGRKITWYRTYNKSGRATIHIYVTATIINLSNSQNIDLDNVAKEVKEILEDALNGSAGFYDVDFEIDLKTEKDVSKIPEDENLIVISEFEKIRSDELRKTLGGDYVNGITSEAGGRISYVDDDIFDGPFDWLFDNGETTIAHEFLHQLGMHGHRKGGLAAGGQGIFIGEDLSEKDRKYFAIQVMKGNVNNSNWFNTFFPDNGIVSMKSTEVTRTAGVDAKTTNSNAKQSMDVKRSTTYGPAKPGGKSRTVRH